MECSPKGTRREKGRKEEKQGKVGNCPDHHSLSVIKAIRVGGGAPHEKG